MSRKVTLEVTQKNPKMNNEREQRFLSQSKAVDIKCVSVNQRRYLIFDFKDYLSTDEARDAAVAWSTYCDKYSDQSQVYIWNCLKMSGFDAEAKRVWMETLSRYDSQVEEIAMISENIFIRGAARLMSKFTRLKLRIYKGTTEEVIRFFEDSSSPGLQNQ